MIVSRKNLVVMVGVSTLTCVLFLCSLFTRSGKISYPPLIPQIGATQQRADASPEPVRDYSGIVAKELFSPERGRHTDPIKTIEPLPVGNLTPELSMLSSYPNEWPRLKLTGIFAWNGRYGAVIQGGDAVNASNGRKYDSLYFEGDAIAGGVMLGPIERNAVTLYKDKNGWKIYIGDEPPVVVQKK